MRTFEEEFSSTCDFAVEQFLADGHYMLMILLGYKNIMAPVGFGDYDDRIRSELPEIFKRVFAELAAGGITGKPEFYITIAESWITTEEEYKEDHIRPSEHPDRVEALIIVGQHKDGRSLMRTYEIRRNPALHLSEPLTKDETNIPMSIFGRAIFG